MEIGYDGSLYVLAFDHRDSFQRRMFGIEGDPTEAQTAAIADAKHLIYEGALAALERGVDRAATGVLIDEQFGGPIPGEAKAGGLLFSMPVEKSGEAEFDFEYGEDFGAHIERFEPDLAKVLVRYNPEGDGAMNERQAERLSRLTDWLHERGGKLLFELLVPPEEAQLGQVGGDLERFDRELRPELMRRAIVELQGAGVEPDVWKIEGLDSREDCDAIARTCRREGRDRVTCVVLGRGADDRKVEDWLRQGAAVEGYAGFAIGRTIWWEALSLFLQGDLDRAAATEQIATKFLRFVRTYEDAARDRAAA